MTDKKPTFAFSGRGLHSLSNMDRSGGSGIDLRIAKMAREDPEALDALIDSRFYDAQVNQVRKNYISIDPCDLSDVVVSRILPGEVYSQEMNGFIYVDSGEGMCKVGGGDDVHYGLEHKFIFGDNVSAQFTPKKETFIAYRKKRN